MTSYALLLSPAANHVYANQTPQLACAELSITAPWASDVTVGEIAGVPTVDFDAEHLDDADPRLSELAAQSAGLVLFERSGELLAPVALPQRAILNQDLVTIPKYAGKTNEQFTDLLLHLTLSQVRTGREQLDVLDPLAGRGTTLLTAWLAGHNGYGVEADDKAVEALAGYLKTYLRRARIKHSADTTPVRRNGRSLGKRFDATARLAEATKERPAHPGAPTLEMTVFTGDTRDSAALYGKKKFDAIVTDAPYGVVHGASDGTQRRRSPGELLAEAVPVWASQLRPGGALGIAWNLHTLRRPELVKIVTDAGLTVCEGGAWNELSHRVDSSIQRDVLVSLRA